MWDLYEQYNKKMTIIRSRSVLDLLLMYSTLFPKKKTKWCKIVIPKLLLHFLFHFLKNRPGRSLCKCSPGPMALISLILHNGSPSNLSCNPSLVGYSKCQIMLIFHSDSGRWSQVFSSSGVFRCNCGADGTWRAAADEGWGIEDFEKRGHPRMIPQHTHTFAFSTHPHITLWANLCVGLCTWN